MTLKPRNQTHHYPALDGVRAVAAIGVVFTHAGFASGRSVDNGPFSGLLARLDFGVTLFFLLSGFVIYRPFARAALSGAALPRTKAFYARRLVRIVPAYWLVVTLTLGVLSFRTGRPSDWAAYIGLVQTYTGHSLDPSLTQMWTLSVELCFYALVPVLARVALTTGQSRRTAIRRQFGLVGTLSLIGILGNLVGNHTSTSAHDSLLWLPANLDWFAAGMLLAVLSVVPTEAVPRLTALTKEMACAGGTCWVLGALVFWIATLPIAGPKSLALLTGWEWTFRHYLYLIAAMLFLLPLTLAPERRFASIVSTAPMRALGRISYGIYLWHLPILIALQHWLGYRTFGGHFVILLVGTLALSIPVATASWLLMERPLIMVVHRNQRHPSSKATTTPSVASANSTRP